MNQSRFLVMLCYVMLGTASFVMFLKVECDKLIIPIQGTLLHGTFAIQIIFEPLYIAVQLGTL